ncbi:MAG: nitrogen fixation protein NifQ [Steroidobacteraceae bacterium]|jgi:nitrogen fixation protein NifQ
MIVSSRGLDRERLLAAARDPGDLANLAFCGVLARFAIRKLESAELIRLLARYFPSAPPETADEALVRAPEVVCAAIEPEEFDDLLALLGEHRRDDLEETRWLAHAIASACAGENHLWEDMGMPDRVALSQLLRRYFPTLYFKNTANLRWKKFFYKLLCDRAQARLCKAPSCGVCSDYELCFGPE